MRLVATIISANINHYYFSQHTCLNQEKMRLRDKIIPPKKYRDEIQDHTKARSRARARKRRKLESVPYNPELPPAAFPTLDFAPQVMKPEIVILEDECSTSDSCNTIEDVRSKIRCVDDPAVAIHFDPWLPISDNTPLSANIFQYLHRSILTPDSTDHEMHLDVLDEELAYHSFADPFEVSRVL